MVKLLDNNDVVDDDDGVVAVGVVGSVHFFLLAVNPPPALNLKWMMSPSSTM